MADTTYTVDAAGQSLGRVASAAAKALMGKISTSYEPRIAPTFKVSITNASKLRIPERKRLGKIYTIYSGHPGGLKRESLSSLLGRKGRGRVPKQKYWQKSLAFFIGK